MKNLPKFQVIIPSAMTEHEKSAMHKYTKELGEIIWAYNSLHAEILSIFSFLIDKNNMQIGKEILLALKSDSAQRDVVRAYCEEKFSKENKILKRNIIWLIDSAGRMSSFRNTIVHSPMTVIQFADGHFALPNVRAVRYEKFKQIIDYKHEKKFPQYLADVNKLTKYARSIQAILGGGMQLANALLEKKGTWPRKPLLRTIAKQKKGGGQKHPPRKKQARKSPPVSSHQ